MAENTKTLSAQVSDLETRERLAQWQTKILQDSFAAAMKREYDLRKELTEARQERNDALYQRDAAERSVSVHEQVIKNLRADLEGTTREVARQKERVNLHAEAAVDARRERDAAVGKAADLDKRLAAASKREVEARKERDEARSRLASILMAHAVPLGKLMTGMSVRRSIDVSPLDTTTTFRASLPKLEIATMMTDQFMEDASPELVALELRNIIAKLVARRVEDYVAAMKQEMK